MTRAPRVDAHLHVWDLDRREQPWIDPVAMAGIRRSFDVELDLGPELTRSGVDRGVLVQVLNRADETDELLAAARTSGQICGVVGWLDMTRADVPDQLERLRASGPLVGVRHQLQAEAEPEAWLARSAVGAGLAHLATAGVPFELLIKPAQFPAALDTVRRHPSLAFVVDHIGKPSIRDGLREPWASGMRALAREPNVSCKLSGMVTVADHANWTVADLRPYAEPVLDEFGADRVMFGSDWPVCLPAADYPQVVAAVGELTRSMSADERAAVWGGTAIRVYGLEVLTPLYP